VAELFVIQAIDIETHCTGFSKSITVQTRQILLAVNKIELSAPQRNDKV